MGLFFNIIVPVGLYVLAVVAKGGDPRSIQGLSTASFANTPVTFWVFAVAGAAAIGYLIKIRGKMPRRLLPPPDSDDQSRFDQAVTNLAYHMFGVNSIFTVFAIVTVMIYDIADLAAIFIIVGMISYQLIRPRTKTLEMVWARMGEK